MIACFIVTPEQKEANDWQAGPHVNANPIPIYGGDYAGHFAIPSDFLALEIVAGSPENENLRGLLGGFPTAEIDPADLRGPEEDL